MVLVAEALHKLRGLSWLKGCRDGWEECSMTQHITLCLSKE